MARYVTPEIEDIRENPQPGKNIDLALVVSDGSISEIKKRVNRHNGNIERHLPSDVLIINLPEQKLDSFCQTEQLESVSSPKRMSTL